MAKENENRNTFVELIRIEVKSTTINKGTADKPFPIETLPWTTRWKVLHTQYPEATYSRHIYPDGNFYHFNPDLGYEVGVAVTINGITHERFLAVTDRRNLAMKDKPYKVVYGKYEVAVPARTMQDIETTSMRCLAKRIAMHGVGFNIYERLDYEQSMKDLQNLGCLDGVLPPSPAQEGPAPKLENHEVGLGDEIPTMELEEALRTPVQRISKKYHGKPMVELLYDRKNGLSAFKTFLDGKYPEEREASVAILYRIKHGDLKFPRERPLRADEDDLPF